MTRLKRAQRAQTDQTSDGETCKNPLELALLARRICAELTVSTELNEFELVRKNVQKRAEHCRTRVLGHLPLAPGALSLGIKGHLKEERGSADQRIAIRSGLLLALAFVR